MGVEDWDQRLFAWVWRSARDLGSRLRRLNGSERALPDHAVSLADIAPRLRLLGAALSGATVDVREAEGAAGYRGDTILLPATIVLGNTRLEALRAYRLGLAYQTVCQSLGLRLPSTSPRPEVASWLAIGIVLAQLEFELPGARKLLDELRVALLMHREPTSSLEGGALALEVALHRYLDIPVEDVSAGEALDWSTALRAAAASVSASSPEDREATFDAACLELERSLGELGDPASVVPFLPFGLLRPAPPPASASTSEPMPPTALASGTERAGKAREAVRHIHLDDRPLADNPLVHSFEKVHTAEEYKGGQKALDGTDELDDHLEALEELDMREVIRTRERTHSIFRADALLDGAAPELHDATPDRPPDFKYDEWDGRKRVYRRAHCNLYLERARPVRAAAAATWVDQTLVSRRRELRELERELARIDLELRPTPRQRQGGEVDVDAAVDSHATLAAGHTPSDRLYVNRRPEQPALSLLILLDLSLSSDAYVGGERVLDVSREAAFVVGEALGDSARLAIAGFHSNTRRDCRFVTIKAFGEGWRQARGRLVGLEPRGYTRIGPALRHGASVLRLNKTRRRALVVVTDGQPTDYDRYEGRHGVEDVAQAVREAERDGVASFALAVSRERRPQLGQMFGSDRYSLLQRGSQLPEAMGMLLTKLVRR